MITSPNERLPCGATSQPPPKIYLAGCYNQDETFITSSKAFINVTKVKNYAAGASNYIDPYAVAIQNGSPDCSPFNVGGCSPCCNPCYICGDGVNGNVPCTPLDPVKFPFLTATSPTASWTMYGLSGSNYVNLYISQSNKVTSSACIRPYGWKSVVANRLFQGRQSFLSKDNQYALDFDYCTSCASSPAQLAPDPMHYLGIASNCSIARYSQSFTYVTVDNGITPCPNGPGTYDNQCTTATVAGTFTQTAFANFTTSLDTYGNEIIITSSGSVNDDGTLLNLATTYVVEPNGDVNEVFTLYGSYYGSLAGIWNIITGTHSPSGSVWHLANTASIPCYDPCGFQLANDTKTYNTLDINYNTTGATMTYNQYQYMSALSECTSQGTCNGTFALVNSETITILGTSWLHTITSGPALGTTNFSGALTLITVNGNLSLPYSASQVQQSITDLLGVWDMGDAANQMPWRTDGLYLVSPLVSVDEVQNVPTLKPGPAIVTGYSGQVIGRPGPANIDRMWDRDYKQYCLCCGLVDTTNETFYTKQAGAWSTDPTYGCYTPRATQWVDASIAGNLPQGAFLGNYFMNSFPPLHGASPGLIANGMWGGKYALKQVQIQSYNYARPCGADRFQISQSSARCITSYVSSSGVLTIDATATPFNSGNKIVNGNYVWVCGSILDNAGGVDGLYTVSSVTATTCVLSSLVASASNIPILPTYGCGTGFIGLMRWPTMPNQYAACGRTSLTAVNWTSGSTYFTMSVADPSYFIPGDIVKVSDSKNTYFNNYWTISAILDSQDFTVNAGTTVSQSYTGFGQLYAKDAITYDWADTSPKGDQGILNWDWDMRTIAEYNRIQTESASLAVNNDCTSNNCTQSFMVPLISIPYSGSTYCGYGQGSNNIKNFTCTTKCLPFTNCNSDIIYFSPNTESFVATTSYNAGWGGAYVYDSLYGAMWQGFIKNAMADPIVKYWPCPCQYDTPATAYNCLGNEGNVWLRDPNHNCDANGGSQFYYPDVDYFEFTCHPITGAPLLLPGTYIGCSPFQSSITSGSCNPNICNPPEFGNINAVFGLLDCSSGTTPGANVCPAAVYSVYDLFG